MRRIQTRGQRASNEVEKTLQLRAAQFTRLRQHEEQNDSLLDEDSDLQETLLEIYQASRSQVAQLHERKVREKKEPLRPTDEAVTREAAEAADAQRIADEADAREAAEAAEASRIADEADVREAAEAADAQRIADEAAFEELVLILQQQEEDELFALELSEQP